MEEENKKIDESWKESINKEKLDPLKKDNPIEPKVDFIFFISTLGIQASIALGQIANPVTNTTERDLKQAKFLIDTLDVIKEKTLGNLNMEENNLLENMLYELKMVYLAKNKEGDKSND
ncbi:MAG: DUF1844 domain-containing protein [Candidatus Omnitrophota bacterium]